MANIINTDFLEEGERNVIIRLTIKGSGIGDEIDTVVIDPSTFQKPIESNNIKVKSIIPGTVKGFDAVFKYESSDPLQSLEFAAFTDGSNEELCLGKTGGNINLVPGATGNILLTTTGLSIDDIGVFTIVLQKKSKALQPL